ncbi:hypothetical protein SDC9_81738 [bioreactor metagenome]|uniref:Uncharacterized protein n=1 Tax=bioreactor metagenome TaxID=1076179 RepID=A0A644Z4F2_9ZZZZ
MPLVHAPCGYDQHSGKRGKRQLRHDITEQKHRKKQADCVKYTGKTRLAAGFYRDAGACYCRSRGNSAEKGNYNIADPLCDQLLIRVKAFVFHTGCACSAQQAFYHSQRGYCNRR